MRNGFEQRFELSSPTLGVIDYTSTLLEATQYMLRLNGTVYEDVVVYDRMAKIGGVDERKLKNGRLVGIHRRERG